MFNVWSFRRSAAVVSSGLGGGSLIYANVLIRKDEKWFVREDLQGGGYEYWPVTRAVLDPHYEQVEKTLNAQKYPLHRPPYDKTPKTLAMREAAQRPNLEWLPLNLAVSFRTKHVGNPDHPDDVADPPRVGEPIQEAQPNYHNMTRYTCRLCGECDIGCNYGSKNTLDYTYLTEAHRLGADLRTLCEVKEFSPLDHGRKGYRVSCIKHNPAQWEGRKADTADRQLFPPQAITCERLILAAGTFGTPFLLFKNSHALPQAFPLSARNSGRISV
jgi:cholesterol oxidase